MSDFLLPDIGEGIVECEVNGASLKAIKLKKTSPSLKS